MRTGVCVVINAHIVNLCREKKSLLSLASAFMPAVLWLVVQLATSLQVRHDSQKQQRTPERPLTTFTLLSFFFIDFLFALGKISISLYAEPLFLRLDLAS